MIAENPTPFLIGAIPNHRYEEHLFTLKSVFALVEHNKDAIGIELLDLLNFFDHEVLLDAMDELHKANVKGKLYKLIYELNRNTKIRVIMAVGESKERETGENKAQGLIDGGKVSSNNLSKGFDDFFFSSLRNIITFL